MIIFPVFECRKNYDTLDSIFLKLEEAIAYCDTQNKKPNNDGFYYEEWETS